MSKIIRINKQSVTLDDGRRVNLVEFTPYPDESQKTGELRYLICSVTIRNISYLMIDHVEQAQKYLNAEVNLFTARDYYERDYRWGSSMSSRKFVFAVPKSICEKYPRWGAIDGGYGSNHHYSQRGVQMAYYRSEYKK